MISVLRLTTMLLWMPSAAAFALQVTPRPAPRPKLERPRIVEPRVEKPFDGWHDFELFKPDFHYDMPKLESEMFKLDHEMMKLDHELMKLDKFDMHDMKMDFKFDKFDSKLYDLDTRFREFEWKSEPFHYTPRPDVSWGRELFATSPRAPWLQGDPADSLYKAAYELLNRGEWRRAATTFANLPQRFPGSGYAADAMYWQAFALYRIGGTEDLNTALRSLETLRAKYPSAKTQSDAAALNARIRGALAARGDQASERQLRAMVSEQGQQCDREDQAVRIEAIKSLAQTDPAGLPALAKRVLAKKDPCSARLRSTVVYLLGNSGDTDAPAVLRDVALNDPDAEVRGTAMQYLARSPSDVAVNTLEEVLRTSTDQNVLRSAARALASNPNPRARQAVRALIERGDAPERLRIEAVGGFENSERTTDEDAKYLRDVYPKIDNPRVKARIARVIGQLGGEQNDAWLLGLMRNNDEPVEVRTAALERVASRRMPIADAVKLYNAVADKPMRERLISVYRQRTEAEATDKLLDIAKNDTDYNLRTRAIAALTEKKDPRAQKLLLEIIDK